eukprot:13784935-Heterocapsa_arctica.AAC.1
MALPHKAAGDNPIASLWPSPDLYPFSERGVGKGSIPRGSSAHRPSRYVMLFNLAGATTPQSMSLAHGERLCCLCWPRCEGTTSQNTAWAVGSVDAKRSDIVRPRGSVENCRLLYSTASDLSHP